MGPQIALYNSTNTELLFNWDIGELRAQVPSEVLTVNIWNNRSGSVDVSDLRDSYLQVLDSTGDTANDDIPKEKWIQVNEPSVDGNSDTFTPIGGTVGKDIKANGLSSSTTCYISGKANDGVAANSPQNVCTINLRAVAPPNANPGDKTFKVRISGYFT
jgi:hypothetical protein